MIKKFRADLHIHSCLSPCAELDMTPTNIISRAVELGLDLVAISDHNSAQNVEVAIKIAGEHDITVLPAMEITTAEEVHVLAVFDKAEDSMKVQDTVQREISVAPSYRHDETSQPVVNEKDEVLTFNPLPLINATNISLSSLVDLVHDNNGLAIACHIDKEAFSIISQLGFIPEGLPLDAVEVSYRVMSGNEIASFFTGQTFPALSFSDAHHISDIGRRVTEFTMAEPSIEEISKCLGGQEGRNVEIMF